MLIEIDEDIMECVDDQNDVVKIDIQCLIQKGKKILIISTIDEIDKKDYIA